MRKTLWIIATLFILSIFAMSACAGVAPAVDVPEGDYVKCDEGAMPELEIVDDGVVNNACMGADFKTEIIYNEKTGALVATEKQTLDGVMIERIEFRKNGTILKIEKFEDGKLVEVHHIADRREDANVLYYNKLKKRPVKYAVGGPIVEAVVLDPESGKPVRVERFNPEGQVIMVEEFNPANGLLVKSVKNYPDGKPMFTKEYDPESGDVVKLEKLALDGTPAAPLECEEGEAVVKGLLISCQLEDTYVSYYYDEDGDLSQKVTMSKGADKEDPMDDVEVMAVAYNKEGKVVSEKEFDPETGEVTKMKILNEEGEYEEIDYTAEVEGEEAEG